MKKLLLDIHIYSGLLCTAYLIIYGLSTISFNHHHEPSKTKTEWARAVDVRSIKGPAKERDQKLAAALRDQLGLLGWVPWWRIKRESDIVLPFDINRPTRTYHVHLDQQTGQVEVEELNSGIWGAVRGLHGLTGIPNSSWAATWNVYTEISVLAIFFSALSGVYFWWGRPSEHRIGFWLLGLLSGGTLLFVSYVIW
jgi:hypothetical protein